MKKEVVIVVIADIAMPIYRVIMITKQKIMFVPDAMEQAVLNVKNRKSIWEGHSPFYQYVGSLIVKTTLPFLKENK